MAKIIWTEPSLDDLDKIADYIALLHPLKDLQITLYLENWFMNWQKHHIGKLWYLHAVYFIDLKKMWFSSFML
jgi:hypothetical protein